MKKNKPRVVKTSLTPAELCEAYRQSAELELEKLTNQHPFVGIAPVIP